MLNIVHRHLGPGSRRRLRYGGAAFAAVVLASSAIAPAANAQPVKQVLDFHNCDDEGDRVVCTGLTGTLFTNSVMSGDRVVFQERIDATFTEVDTSAVPGACDQSFSTQIKQEFVFVQQRNTHRVIHTEVLDHTVNDCLGVHSDCTLSGIIQTIADDTGVRVIFDHTEFACQPAAGASF